MNINWKVRWKNVIFVIQIIIAAILPVIAYMGLTLEDFSSWPMVWETFLNAIKNPYIVGLFIFNVWCAINDPTTHGIKDSERALGYHKPYDDENPEEAYKEEIVE